MVACFAKRRSCMAVSSPPKPAPTIKNSVSMFFHSRSISLTLNGSSVGGNTWVDRLVYWLADVHAFARRSRDRSPREHSVAGESLRARVLSVPSWEDAQAAYPASESAPDQACQQENPEGNA